MPAKLNKWRKKWHPGSYVFYLKIQKSDLKETFNDKSSDLAQTGEKRLELGMPLG